MENTNGNDKLFGNLAVGLLIAGLLVPFIIAAFASEQLAMGFAVVAIILALVFGILGWRYKTGKVTVIICAGLAVLSLVTFMLYFRNTKASEQHALEQAKQEAARAAEQRTERDSQ